MPDTAVPSALLHLRASGVSLVLDLTEGRLPAVVHWGADLGDTTGAFGGHGGGDERLAADFVSLLSGRTPSISCTMLSDSINGHLIGFLADRSMNSNQVMTLPRE